jgi:hypothetical protein
MIHRAILALLITEAALVRDAQSYSSSIEGLEDIELKNADELRPDLVVVADDLLVVLEAKFFLGSITQSAIRKQLLAQRQVIETVYLRFPGYSFRRYSHLFLSARPPASAEVIGCQGILSWADIRDLAVHVLGKEHYVTQRLARALELYESGDARQGERGPNYRGKKPLNETLRMCEREGKAVQIGFTGGVRAVEGETPERLERRKFKWDRVQNSIGRKDRSNWIAGDRFLGVIRRGFPRLLP